MSHTPNTQTGSLSGKEKGTNDIWTGPDGSAFSMYFGDAVEMYDRSRGGHDTLTGSAGSSSESILYGDAWLMYDDSKGGNDVLTGGANALKNLLYGDAFEMFDNAVGGNDVLTGGANAVNNHLLGDARYMSGNAVGGNDILIGTAVAVDALNTSAMVGDAYTMSDNAVCGNDVLISGTGYDRMWGDGVDVGANVVFGTDSFVFGPNNGDDEILDFHQADHDQIDLSAYGFAGIEDLDITVGVADTVIDFGSGNSVTLVGFTDPLTASDFIF